MISYWIKTVHKEIKQLLKELTDYTHELRELIVGIQTHIIKGIETDIQEIKADIKTLYGRTNKNENQIASLEEKVKNNHDSK